MPINRTVVRLRELKIPELRVLLQKRIEKSQREALFQFSAFNVGAFDALLSVRVLARIDGIIVVELGIDETKYADHYNTDLDELAQFVCGCAKSSLGHVHDAHDSILPWSQQELDPERMLVAYPVKISAEQWKPLFEAESFTDTDLRETDGVPPRTAPEGPSRNALLCLRRGYLKVFEVLVGRLKIDRQQQVEWKKQAKFHYVAYALIASLILIFSYPPLPADAKEWVLVFLGPFALSFFMYYLRQFWKWDRRRIRLLRAGSTFFSYVNPFNRVAGVALGKKRTPPDDFADLQEILKTKVDGETHRASVHQFWMSLCVGVFGVVAAILALDEATIQVVSQQEAAIERALDDRLQPSASPALPHKPTGALSVPVRRAARADITDCVRTTIAGGAALWRC